MIFKFLKYLQPTHYFLLKEKENRSIYPIISELPQTIRLELEPEPCYKSQTAIDYDLSWQALHKGYIGTSSNYTEFEELSIYDNYVFIRKYFNKAWVFYVLLLRLMSFKNPILELTSWLKTRKVKQSDYLKTPLTYPEWSKYKSVLVEAKPKVTVVIPTLNRYAYLKDVLKDLEAQDYTNFETIVIDQSDPFNDGFYSNFKLDLVVEHQIEKALWLARNTAIKRAKGQYLLLFDDDSRVESDWIRNHLKALDFFNADLSSGVSISKIGAEIPSHYSFFRISDQLDTGNVMIKKEVFETIGLFDRQFEKQRMGDGEYGLRAFLNGFLNISNPHAHRLHLKAGSGGLREMGSWDAFRTSNLFAPRPIPSVLYFFRRYFGPKQSKLALLRTVPLSIMPYRFKKNKIMLLIGMVISIVILPLVVFQVIKSWRLSSQKLRNGPLIEKLQ